MTGVPRACAYCNGVFEPVGEYAGFARRFCSRACADAAKRQGSALVCAECGATFYAKASRVKAGRKYCSRACWRPNSGLSEEQYAKNSVRLHETRRGAGNPRFKHGRNGNRAWRSRFNLALKGENCCRNCGSTQALQLHHAIPRSMSRAARDELLNGLPLCVTCHMSWHRRGRVILYRDLFTAEEWTYISSVELIGQDIGAWLDVRYPVRAGIREFPR